MCPCEKCPLSLLHDHAGGDGIISRFVDNDEISRRAIARVTVDVQRLLYFNAHVGDVVHMELGYAVGVLQSSYIHPVSDSGNQRSHLVGRMLDDVSPFEVEGRLAEPADNRLRLLHAAHAIAALADTG